MCGLLALISVLKSLSAAYWHATDSLEERRWAGKQGSGVVEKRSVSRDCVEGVGVHGSGAEQGSGQEIIACAYRKHEAGWGVEALSVVLQGRLLSPGHS